MEVQLRTILTSALGWKSLANTELEYFTIMTLTDNCSVRKEYLERYNQDSLIYPSAGEVANYFRQVNP